MTTMNVLSKEQIEARYGSTVDTAPTQNSTNLVTSGGVKTALDGKMDAMTVDSAPTQNSTNLVTSGGVYTALNNVLKIETDVSVSTWVSDSTYSDYGYRASILITGVTASDVAWVTFGVTEATSGDYAPFCETYAGGVYIYAKANTSITIDNIIVFRG